MKTHFWNTPFFKRALALSLTLALLAGYALTMRQPPPPTPNNNPERMLSQKGLAAYAQLPLYFIANKGQWEGDIAYSARLGEYAVAFTAEAVLVALGERRVRIHFPGANAVRPVGAQKQTARINYLIGDDPAGWRTNIPTYGQIRYPNLYPGIDLHYAGQGSKIEYTLVVKPGADVSQFQMAFEGAESLRLDEEGNLRILLDGGEVRDTRPLAYQEIGGRRVPVEAAFVLRDAKTIGFAVRGDYDSRYPLFIDPTLEYATFLGGAMDDTARDVAVDGAGNLYVAGYTSSTDFPTQNPYQGAQEASDAIVLKIAPAQDGAASLVYATYLGGSKEDTGEGIVVDGNGNAYVIGSTRSPNFPVTAGAFDTTCGSDGNCNSNPATSYGDGFIVKLNAAGDGLVYATYLGGSNTDVLYRGIAVDGNGNAYVAGYTWSTDFPITAGAFDTTCGTDGNCNYDAQLGDSYPDGFIVKLNPAGSNLVYATYVGGSNRDFFLRLDVDGNGNAYAGGHTWSTDFPTTANAYQQAHAGGDRDVVVAKLNATGSSLVYSTFLGGSHIDEGYGLDADDAGNVYLTGVTHSQDFPTQNPYQSACALGSFGCYDGFIAKIDTTKSNANSLLYATYLGASRIENGYSIAAENGVAYITGWTTSPDFPATANAYDAECGSDGNCDYTNGVRYSDVFIAEIDTAQSGAASLTYATFFGGRRNEYGHGIAADGKGNTYVVGATESSDFPVTAGAFDTTCGSDGNCNYDPNEPYTPYADDFFVAVFTRHADLSASRKEVAPSRLEPSGTLLANALRYTITLSNTGDLAASAVRLTDTLPLRLNLTAGPTCPGYTCGYDGSRRAITWTGSLSAGVSALITYTAQLSAVIGAGESLLIINTAQVNDGQNTPFTLSAVVAVNPRLLYLPLILR